VNRITREKKLKVKKRLFARLSETFRGRKKGLSPPSHRGRPSLAGGHLWDTGQILRKEKTDDRRGLSSEEEKSRLNHLGTNGGKKPLPEGTDKGTHSATG